MYLTYWKTEDDFKELINKYIEQRRPYLLHETEAEFKRNTRKYALYRLRQEFRFDPITWIFIAYKVYRIIRFLINVFYAKSHPH